MIRRLLNLPTLLSMLACPLVLALWAWTYDTWRVGTRPGQVVAYVTWGADGETFVRQSLQQKRQAAEGWVFMRGHASTSLAFAGFEFYRGTTPRSGMTFAFALLAVPLWPLVAMTLALPAVRLCLACRRRTRHGRCGLCGYDLTGNVSGVCPECGTAR